MVRVMVVGVAVGLAAGCGRSGPTGADAKTDPWPAAGPQTLLTVGPRTIALTGAPGPAGLPDTPPPGLAVRLGTEDGKPTRGWGGAVLLPGGKRLFAPHSVRPDIRHSMLHYTLYEVDGLKPVGEPILSGANGTDHVGDAPTVSADGRRLATIGTNFVNVFDLTTGERLLKVPRPNYSIQSATLSGDGSLLAVGINADDRAGAVPAVAVWSVADGNEVKRFPVVQNRSAWGVLSPDGHTLVTGGYHQDPNFTGKSDDIGNLTQHWDVPTGRELFRLSGSMPRFAPDSKAALVVTAKPPSVRLIDPRTGKTLRELPKDDDEPGPWAFTSDGTVLAKVGPTATTRWEVATGRKLGTTPRPAGLPPGVAAAQAAFDGPDRLVAFAADSAGRTAYVWDALGGTVLAAPAAGHRSSVTGAAFTSDGKQVLTSGNDGDLWRWDAATGKPAGRFTLKYGSGVYFPLLLPSADGRRAVTPGGVFDAGTGGKVGDLTAALPKGASYTYAAYPSADGALVAVVPGPLPADKPNACRVWDPAAGKVVADLALPPGGFRVYAAFAPGNRRLATAVSGQTSGKYGVVVQGWELTGGKKLGELVLPDVGGLMGFAALDERRVAVGTGFGRMFVVDYVDGKTVREIADPARVAVEAATAGPGGKLLAVAQTVRGSVPKVVRVYDADTGEARHTIPYARSLDSFSVMANSPHPPELMAFSPDGGRLAVPVDTSVLVWDLSKFGPDGPRN